MTKKPANDTIAAISTPIGEGGIGIVRLSGADSLKIADRIFIPKNGKKPSICSSHSVHYGQIARFAGRSKEIIDEALVTIMKAPRSYTREDTVEINCHGGIQATKKVLELVLKNGARMAEPGEFTKRAFLNGRLDLAQAEAVLDVIRSKTESSLKIAMNQLEGGLSARVNMVLDELISIAARMEAAIDFPEEDVEIINKKELYERLGSAIREVEDMSDSYGEGAVLREGVLAIICGKPNVGKSSLMNLLLKRDRVIVSPVPGTTRDSVEEMINLKGIPVRLVDTAGITRGRDALEKEGIRRSKRYVGMADIALFLLDASRGITGEDRSVLKLLGGIKKLIIINKIDAGKKLTASGARRLFPRDKVVEISVEKKKNIEELEKAIAELIWGGRFSQGEGAVVSNARQKELLDSALKSMVSVSKLIEEDSPPEVVAIDLKEAITKLGLIVGKSVSDDILHRIFAEFCIGK